MRDIALHGLLGVHKGRAAFCGRQENGNPVQQFVGAADRRVGSLGVVGIDLQLVDAVAVLCELAFVQHEFDIAPFNAQRTEEIVVSGLRERIGRAGRIGRVFGKVLAVHRGLDTVFFRARVFPKDVDLADVVYVA